VSDHAETAPDVAAARDDVQRARDQLSDTIAEIEARVTAPVRAVTRRLDVGRLIQEHPWAALATAVGVGAAVAASGADGRAASIAAGAARKGVEKAREGGVVGARLARQAPSRSRQAVGSIVDAIGAKLAMSVIDALRQPTASTGDDEARSGLGFVRHDAPAHSSEQDGVPQG
jgi:ElaB/YqjD/DUF883 family membrane-anchored ribosome-binding protein